MKREERGEGEKKVNIFIHSFNKKLTRSITYSRKCEKCEKYKRYIYFSSIGVYYSNGKKSTMATSKTISETQATYYPPSLMPPFMGAYPPTKLGVSLFEGGKIGYFQNYRNETLSKLSVSFLFLLKRKYITLLTLFVSNRRFVKKKKFNFQLLYKFYK